MPYSRQMKHYTTEDFKRWGRIGGAKSRRILTTEQAKKMRKIQLDAKKLSVVSDLSDTVCKQS